MILSFWALLAISLPAQLQIYSEFRRVDAKGEILAQDSEGKAREILSPGLIRNGYHTLRIVVRPLKNTHYALLLAQNPENSVRMKLYRELPPDKLELVKTPFEWDGMAVHTFLVDMFTPADAIVRRVRIEAQLNDGSGWIIYPMEVRILMGIVPNVRFAGVALPPITAPSDAPARAELRSFVCDEQLARATNGFSARSLVSRNAHQDILLARSLQLKWTKERLADRLAQIAGAENAAAWCAPQPGMTGGNPEWYLKVRDYLYKEASH